MSVIDTTNIIDNSIFLKAKLPPNMIGENYYIENLQDKRNYDWEYRYNRVFIEEELNKQSVYTNENPIYTPIDSVVTNVKNEKGQSLGTDWASLSFRDLKHPNHLGSRYRFSLDFPDMRTMSEEEKQYNTSIWICINQIPIHAGNSCVVRRCNSFIKILGYENRDRRRTKTREIHYEPIILDNDQMKYMQMYYNQDLPVPQSEWYAILQLNYFTNNIKLNDRFLFGTYNKEVRENSSVFTVKGIIKSNTLNTFTKDEDNGVANTPLLILSLERDALNPYDDLENRIANNTTIYLIPNKSDSTEKDIPVPEKEKPDKYVLKDVHFVNERISLGTSQQYELKLYQNDIEIINPVVEYTVELTNKQEPEWSKYFDIEYNTEGIGFTILNKKTCIGGILKIKVSCKISDGQESIEKEYNIILDKSY